MCWILLSLLLPTSRFAWAAETVFFEAGKDPVVQAVLSYDPGGNDVGRPLVVLLGGFETGKAAIRLIQKNPGVVLAGVDYPFRLEGKWTAEVFIQRGLELRKALRQTDRVLCELVDRFREHPSVDARRVVLVGVSFGAPFALSAASRCEGVSALVLVQGFGDIPGTLASRIEKRAIQTWGSWWGPILAQSLGTLAWWALDMDSPEASVARLRPDLPVLWIEATEDDLIPESSRTALRGLLQTRAGARLETMPGDHIRPDRPRQVQEILGRSLRWLRAIGVLSPQ